VSRGPGHAGYEARTRSAERRDFFDLRRRMTGADEVFIGPDDPGDEFELWYDTDASAKAFSSLAGYAMGPLTDQTGIGATLTDLTDMSVTWTAQPTHLYLILGAALATQRTSVGSLVWTIRNGSTTVRENRYPSVAVSGTVNLDIWNIEIGASGSQTRKLSLSTSAGTVDVEGNDGRFTPRLLVLDCGSF
jgi:hypothetical protein